MKSSYSWTLARKNSIAGPMDGVTMVDLDGNRQNDQPPENLRSGPEREVLTTFKLLPDHAHTIGTHHYTGSTPSGKTHWLHYGSAIVAWSIPANKNIGQFLLGAPSIVWELSRLWAPDDHEPNLLTAAIAHTLRQFKTIEPEADAVVSYADPNAGHSGGIYRAASWVFCGQCEEGRYYVGENGKPVARRSFHSGGKSMKKTEIEALGFKELRRPGKLRFARGLNRWARKALLRRLPSVD